MGAGLLSGADMTCLKAETGWRGVLLLEGPGIGAHIGGLAICKGALVFDFGFGGSKGRPKSGRGIGMLLDGGRGAGGRAADARMPVNALREVDDEAFEVGTSNPDTKAGTEMGLGLDGAKPSGRALVRRARFAGRSSPYQLGII